MLQSALSFAGEEAKLRYLLEMGRYCVNEYQSLQGRMQPMFDRMGKYESEMGGDVSHRLLSRAQDKEHLLKDGIFRHSNQTLSTTRKNVRYLSSKSFDDVFGSRPYLSLKPQSDDDVNLGAEVQRFIEYKYDQRQSNYESACADAITSAWSLGYGILKPTYKRIAHSYRETVECLCDPDTEEPVMAADGEYITSSSPSGYDERRGGVVFEDDPEGRVWDSPTFIAKAVPRTIKEYAGPELGCVYFKDFFADPDKPRLEECDFICHRQAFRIGELRKNYQNGMIDPDTWTRLLQVAGDDATAAATSDSPAGQGNFQAGDDDGRRAWGTRPNADHVNVIECYFNYEPPGEGSPDEHEDPAEIGAPARMYALVVADTGEVIWADYLGNIMPKAKIPFAVVTCEKKPNKWHGVGFMERYDSEMQAIDKIFNSILIQDEYAASPVMAIDEDAILQGKSGEKFEIGPGKHIKLRPQATLAEAIEVLQLPQPSDSSWALMEFMQQNQSQDSGVSAANTGDTSSMDANHTLGGLKQILGHGSIMNKLSARQVHRGIEDATRLTTELTLWRMGPEEPFRYFDGTNEVGATLERDRAIGTEYDITLNLTRFGAEEEMARLARVTITVERYLAIPPMFMEAVRPIFIKQLEKMEIENAEEVLPIPDLTMLGGGGGEPPAPPATPPEDAPPEPPEPPKGGGDTLEADAELKKDTALVGG